MELDLLVVPVRSMIRPVLESIALPELSIILVLGALTELLFVTDERVLAVEPLPEIAERVFEDVLPPDNAERVAVLLVELLPDTPPDTAEDLLAKLLL